MTDLQELRRVFKLVADHYQLSVPARLYAWDSAMSSREHAYACYSAIERSLQT